MAKKGVALFDYECIVGPNKKYYYSQGLARDAIMALSAVHKVPRARIAEFIPSSLLHRSANFSIASLPILLRDDIIFSNIFFFFFFLGILN